MVKCYAKCLNECSSVQSKEHYISQGIWQNQRITFEGFSWATGKPKTLPVKNVAQKILCTKHNNALSPLDVEAQSFFCKLRNFQENQHKRSRKRRGSVWKTDKARFDGFQIERLFAKIGVGVMQEDKTSFWHMGDAARMEPPNEIVETIFGRKRFQAPMGLNLVNFEGDKMLHEDRVTIQTLHHPTTNGYIGSLVAMRGRQFLINLSQLSFEDFQIRSLTGNLFGHQGITPIYRPPDLSWNVRGMVSGVMSFEWSNHKSKTN